MQNILEEDDREVLRSARVVGMTTTNAAMNHSLLAGLEAKVVLVEEAGEVLESHILTCLSPSNEQLVLIGDHCQLRPKTQVVLLVLPLSQFPFGFDTVENHLAVEYLHRVHN
jgi:hypothetical protein